MDLTDRIFLANKRKRGKDDKYMRRERKIIHFSLNSVPFGSFALKNHQILIFQIRQVSRLLKIIKM